jgi:hypothetical protein
MSPFDHRRHRRLGYRPQARHRLHRREREVETGDCLRTYRSDNPIRTHQIQSHMPFQSDRYTHRSRGARSEDQHANMTSTAANSLPKLTYSARSATDLSSPRRSIAGVAA